MPLDRRFAHPFDESHEEIAQRPIHHPIEALWVVAGELADDGGEISEVP